MNFCKHLTTSHFPRWGISVIFDLTFLPGGREFYSNFLENVKSPLCFVAIVTVRSIMLTCLFSLFHVTGEYHRFLTEDEPHSLTSGGSKTQVTGHCFTNTGTTLNLY